MSALIRSKDWSKTPLGSFDLWPQSLRTAVSLCLASNFPINLIWGPKHIQIYNDGYRLVCGDAHPAALGEGYDVTWASAWPVIGAPFVHALGGETSYLENQRMFLTRNGYLEETFFTFSLSPIRDESGGIGGLFHPVTETTSTMLAERRTRALRDLSAHLSTATDIGALAAKTSDILANYVFDLPFALFYELQDGDRQYRLAAHHGLKPGFAEALSSISVDASAPWPIAEVYRLPRIIELKELPSLFQDATCGPYKESSNRAFVLPIRAFATDLTRAIVIVGVSPRLPLDDTYRGFYELLAGSISAALAVVRAREEERLRADALAAIDRAKTSFFSNVSHEFRTPLTLILGPVEDALAEAETLPDQQLERVNLIHRNALRLLKLVNTLLEFSRIEAGRVQAFYAPTNLALLTADLASNFQAACDRAALEFSVECGQLSRPVYVDRDMWEKIVLNLLSNAFKFTFKGSIRVLLDECEDGVVFSVSDTGVGISAKELPHLFERFYRIEGQRGRTHEGTGIGLSLVQELVTLHGGTITVESREGEGTVFQIRLRFGAEHLDRDRIQPVSVSSPSSILTRPEIFVEEVLRWLPAETGAKDISPDRSFAAEAGPRVLLADDNADMRNYVRRILESGGYVVDAVGDGAAALAAIRKGPMPDLVLCDVMMPELDGFGLLKALRADPVLEGLLVVMLSARAGEEARVEGLAAGADDYLVKPLSAREFRARIDGAVRAGMQRREAAEREHTLNIELERRVAERTAELQNVNEQLTTALLDRAVAVQALERSEAEFRASFEGAAVGKTLVEPSTKRIVRANRAFAKMVGYEPDELIGRTRIEFTWPEDVAVDDMEYTRFLNGADKVYLREKRYMRRDGTPFWVRISSTLVRVKNEGDCPLLAVATIEDIDARRNAEDELRTAKRELERVVDERTAALGQRDVLLREVYHRVKNNLQIVDSLLMMQASKLENTSAQQALLGLRSQVYALGLVHHQLMGSRDLKTFDVAPFLRELSSNILEGYATKHVHLNVDAGPLAVGLDFAIPLGMLVTELLTNSLKHAFTEGGGTISVVLSTHNNSDIVLVVSDDGQGQHRGDAVHGPGLGRRIVEGLVAQIGGTLTVHNEHGTSTEVRAKIPAQP